MLAGISELMGEFGAFNGVYGANGHPGTGRLWHGFSGFGRIKLHDRKRAGDGLDLGVGLADIAYGKRW